MLRNDSVHPKHRGGYFMIRFSLVIQNEKQEFLVCETIDAKGQQQYEFPGGEINTTILPPFEDFLKTVHDLTLKDVSIDICDIERFELYCRESPFFVHTIFTAKISTGSPRPIKYSSVRWISSENIDMASLNDYGLQVIQKINECSYCHFLRQRREEINRFFDDYFQKAEDNLAVLEVLNNADRKDAFYMVAFKQEMVHLRASLIENEKLKKNITIQNYLRLYGRGDLANKIDELLQVKVSENLTLRDMIKITVDKFIAHYDNPSSTEKEVYDYCFSFFSYDGQLPLAKFVRLLNSYIMSLITQMWYDAGELGVPMSERRSEDQNIIIEFGEKILSDLLDALVSN